MYRLHSRRKFYWCTQNAKILWYNQTVKFSNIEVAYKNISLNLLCVIFY